MNEPKPIKRVVESHKPVGLTYYYSCGHTYFMPRSEVTKFVYQDGPDAPRFCPTCSPSTEEA